MRRAVLVLVLLVVATAAAVAGEPSLAESGAPPEAIPQPLRDLLSPRGVEVSLDGAEPIAIWTRRDLGGSGREPKKLGVAFAEIPAGALVGAVRFPAPWVDYRGNEVTAGVYTARYAARPVDGYHMGVSIHRDFLLLVPAADDREAGAMSYGDLVEASRTMTGARHPAVMSLFPLPDGTQTPSTIRNELDRWMLATRIGSIPVGIVLRGEGEY